jgi:lysophospholipase L1-like esterase
MRRLFLIGALLPVGLMVLMDTAQSAASIVLAGDSTVAAYPESDPKRGWGQMLGEFLADGVLVSNLAIPGASSKTFLASKNWPKALKERGAWLLVQFGHNDSKIGKHPGATEAGGEFSDNLRRFVTEARAAGMRPVFVTPMHRVKFDAGGRLTQELAPYAAAMQKVADAENVPVIDLFSTSAAFFQPLGDQGSLDLNPSAGDRVHFSAKGARLLAKGVADQLARIDPTLVK